MRIHQKPNLVAFGIPISCNKTAFTKFTTIRLQANKFIFCSRRPARHRRIRCGSENRTGQQESIVFRNDVYKLDPTAVKEFSVATGLPAILYVRSCISKDQQQVCEWSPKSLDTGIYYALVDTQTPGGLPNSHVDTVDLKPVVGTSGGATEASPAKLRCRLQVPVLNVRSGPGLQYQIIAKIRGSESEPGTAIVVGRDTTSQWLAVDGSIASGGWVTSSPSFMLCDGDTNSLPVVEATSPQLAPTVVPAPTISSAQAAVPQAAQAAPAATATPTVQPTPSAPVVPPGQALLVVNNGFQFKIRFTLDQKYRVQQGPSEFDLEPGQTINIVVFPGHFAFTASSAWRGLSGNADLSVDADQAMNLWLRFEPESDGSSNWKLAWQ